MNAKQNLLLRVKPFALDNCAVVIRGDDSAFGQQKTHSIFMLRVLSNGFKHDFLAIICLINYQNIILQFSLRPIFLNYARLRRFLFSPFC